MRLTTRLAFPLALALFAGQAGPAQSTEPVTEHTEDHVESDLTGEHTHESTDTIDVRAELVSLERVLDEHWGFGHHVTYNVRLVRSDVDEAPESGISNALSKALRPKRLYVSTPKHGKSMCSRPRAPHACEIEVTPNNDEPTRIQLDVTFEDGVERTLHLDVPDVPSWGRPEIASFVEDDGAFSLTFTDRGAPRYKAIIQLYRGGPGNPFEDRVVSILDRKTPDAPLALDAESTQLQDYKISLLAHDDTITLDARPTHADARHALPGPVAVVAICGEGTVPATDTQPKTWVRECDILHLESPR